MLNSLKRMMIRERARTHWREVEAWSRERGFHFRRARDDAGFVIDVKLGERDGRLEWGPSQRDYIVGAELRLRTELGLPNNLQLLVLSRPLMHELERETFERFTDTMQTHIDTSTPEEMRWLAMYEHFSFGAGRTPLAARIGAVGSSRSALSRWLEGPLAERSLELMCRRALSRVAFGRTIAEQGVTRERIAEARCMIEQARLLTLKAAWMMDVAGNKTAKAEIAMIKVVAPNMACQVIDWAMQAHGGGGVSEDFPLAGFYSSARTLRFADGPDEVHRNAIAKMELGKHG